MKQGSSTDADEVTEDTLLRGRVRIFQPARGYRSSLDPVLLANFLTPPFGRFLDIGCGTGAVAFSMLSRDPDACGVGIEIQPRLAGLLERGIVANHFQRRLVAVAADAREPHPLLADGAFDLIACNPPFFPVARGVLPSDAERAVAHHEVSLTLAAWLDVTIRCLRRNGRLGVIFPRDRLDEFATAALARGLWPERVRDVQARAAAAPTRVMVESRHGEPRTRPCHIEPPLVLQRDGQFFGEARAWLGD